jgi:hypothetical protein
MKQPLKNREGVWIVCWRVPNESSDTIKELICRGIDCLIFITMLVTYIYIDLHV